MDHRRMVKRRRPEGNELGKLGLWIPTTTLTIHPSTLFFYAFLIFALEKKDSGGGWGGGGLNNNSLAPKITHIIERTELFADDQPSSFSHHNTIILNLFSKNMVENPILLILLNPWNDSHPKFRGPTTTFGQKSTTFFCFHSMQKPSKRVKTQ